MNYRESVDFSSFTPITILAKAKAHRQQKKRGIGLQRHGLSVSQLCIKQPPNRSIASGRA